MPVGKTARKNRWQPMAIDDGANILVAANWSAESQIEASKRRSSRSRRSSRGRRGTRRSRRRTDGRSESDGEADGGGVGSHKLRCLHPWRNQQPVDASYRCQPTVAIRWERNHVTVQAACRANVPLQHGSLGSDRDIENNNSAFSRRFVRRNEGAFVC